MRQVPAARPSIVSYRDRPRTSRIILHDSNTGPEIANAEAWLTWRGRQMGLLETGYHFLVDAKGGFVAPRPIGSIGNHTPGSNHDSVGVCLIGNGDFPVDQMVSLMALIIWLMVEKYPGARLYGRTELQRSRRKPHRLCPNLDMDRLRDDLRPALQVDPARPTDPRQPQG